MAEANANYRPFRPLVIGRELVRPSTPALPTELPSHAYMHPAYFTVADLRAVPSHIPVPWPFPIPLRAREEISAPRRRRVLLPRWVMRPCVSTDRLNQPPAPNVADGASELVLVDFVSREIVRAHESCDDARNPDGPTTCTSCPLFYLTVANANVRPPMWGARATVQAWSEPSTCSVVWVVVVSLVSVTLLFLKL